MKWLRRIWHRFMIERTVKLFRRYETYKARTMGDGSYEYQEMLREQHRYHHRKWLQTMDREKMAKKARTLSSL